MSHRIDIELTSHNDSVWTWRAAGARLPKGTLENSLVYAGANVGDVVRAEAERELDGVTIVSITPPKSAKVGPEVLEIIARPQASGVQVIYAEKSGRGGRDSRDGRDGRDRGPRDGARDGRPPRGPRPDGAGGPGGPGGDRPPRGGPRADRPDRGPRADRPDRTERADRPVRDFVGRNERPGRPAPAREKRLNPGRVHRDALLAALAPEQQPIAEQLFRGGIPAVRQAIIDQNAQLKAAGGQEVQAAPLLALAEDLLPRVRQADWLDRASAALDVADSISLRDLRAVVTQADQAARDDESRETAVKLREALSRRVEGERETWAKDISASIADGKVVRAVRLSTKLPDPGAKLSAEVTAELVAATNAALSADARPDVWASLVEAAADAPFRRSIEPAGLPAKPGEALLATAAQASNRIPSLLKLLGLTMPPPPRAKALPPRPPVTTTAPAVVVNVALVAEAVVTEPVAVEPEPVVTEPVVTEPVVTEPVVTEPVVVEPVVVTESVAVEPVADAPASTDVGVDNI
jgi:hypothetical protein